ncbi:DUF5011 domain-containing protein [Arcanobacterium haemolyticum]|nr:DUF5011 domain-containing protein [Arcanobacterium haemolyticum]
MMRKMRSVIASAALFGLLCSGGMFVATASAAAVAAPYGSTISRTALAPTEATEGGFVVTADGATVGSYSSLVDALNVIADDPDRASKKFVLTISEDSEFQPVSDVVGATSMLYDVDLTVTSANPKSPSRITVMAPTSYPVFRVGAGSSLTISNLILDGGGVGKLIFAEGNPLHQAGTTTEITLNNGTVVENGREYIGISPIHITRGAHLTINDGVTIQNNVADDSDESNSGNGNGAAITASDGTTITINGGTFRNNRSTKEVGVIDFHASKVEINGGTFEANSSGTEGGVIHNYRSQGTLDINGGTFTGNTAARGGAIWASAITTITGGTFTENGGKDTKSGGAIHALQLKELSNATLSKNAARSGGAVYLSANVDAIISDTTFSGNGALWGGGAFITGPDDSTHKVKIQGSTFASNSSNNMGGGIYLSPNGHADIASSTFNGNKSTQGGAIYTKLLGETDPVPADRYHNLTIDDETLFTGNWAASGLAVPPSNYADFTNLKFAEGSDVAHDILTVESLLNNYDVVYIDSKRALKYDANGGVFADEATTKVETVSLDAETDSVEATLAAAPTREGHTFLGWDNMATDEVERLAAGATLTVEDSMSFRAMWNAVPALEIVSDPASITAGTGFDLNSLVVKAEDKEDGDLTDKVAIADDGGFDATKPGVYTIAFSVTDSDGATTTATTTVTVVAKPIESTPEPSQPVQPGKTVKPVKKPILANTGAATIVSGSIAALALAAGIALTVRRRKA